jgi:hypothetical protein
VEFQLCYEATGNSSPLTAPEWTGGPPPLTVEQIPGGYNVIGGKSAPSAKRYTDTHENFSRLQWR